MEILANSALLLSYLLLAIIFYTHWPICTEVCKPQFLLPKIVLVGITAGLGLSTCWSIFVGLAALIRSESGPEADVTIWFMRLLLCYLLAYTIYLLASQNKRKEQQQRFLAKAKEVLLFLGAEQQGDDFLLETKAGRLTVHPDGPDKDELFGLGTVYSRFDDPQKAMQWVDCNRFLGKWDVRSFDGWTVETAIYDLLTRLKTVMG